MLYRSEISGKLIHVSIVLLRPLEHATFKCYVKLNTSHADRIIGNGFSMLMFQRAIDEVFQKSFTRIPAAIFQEGFYNLTSRYSNDSLQRELPKQGLYNKLIVRTSITFFCRDNQAGQVLARTRHSVWFWQVRRQEDKLKLDLIYKAGCTICHKIWS